MKKLILIIAIVFSGMLMQAQSLTQDTIYFENGSSKACLIVGDSEHHIYGKFISSELNPGDTIVLPYKKLSIAESNNRKYSNEYFKKYKAYFGESSGNYMNPNTNEDFIDNLSSAESFAVAVHDQREMIVDSSQKETFLGYMWGTIPAIAFPLDNKTGQNLSDDFSDAVNKELTQMDKSCESIPSRYFESKNDILNRLKNTNTDRLLLFTINNWRSESFTPFVGLITTISYDITVEVYYKDGTLLYTKTITGKDAKFNGGKKKVRAKHGESLNKKILILFKDEEVLQII